MMICEVVDEEAHGDCREIHETLRRRQKNVGVLVITEVRWLEMCVTV